MALFHHSSLSLFLAVVSFIALMDLATAEPPSEVGSRYRGDARLKRELEEMENIRRALKELEESLSTKQAEVMARMERHNALNALERNPSHVVGSPLEKRARSPECYMAAGLSRSCDYKDLIAAVEERDFWNSAMSPGKRRKRASGSVNKPLTLDDHLHAIKDGQVKTQEAKQ